MCDSELLSSKHRQPQIVHQTSQSPKKWKNCEANNFFLKECFERGVIPKSFLPKARTDSKDPEFLKEWHERNKNFALKQISEALKKDKVKEDGIIDELLEKFNLLRSLCNDPVLKELEERSVKKEKDLKTRQ